MSKADDGIILAGLTGPSGSGQSTAAGILSSMSGIVRGVCSFDSLGHRLLEKATVRRAVGSSLGIPDMEEMTGKQARKLLGGIVFDEPEAMAALTSVVHPIMRSWVGRSSAFLRQQRGRGVYVLEGSLLFELGVDGFLDTMIVIGCGRETSIERIVTRDGIGVSSALRRLESQMPLAEKMKRADWVICNGSGTSPDSLAGQVRAILGRIVELNSRA